MKISTRGRYAIRVMLTLAEKYNGEYVPLKQISENQEISQKYIEGIMTDLSKKGLVEAVHGKGGGYKLVKDPSEYSIKEILLSTEGSLAPVACLEKDAPPCPRAANCKTLKMWKGFNKLIDDYFSGITLADLENVDLSDNYII